MAAAARHADVAKLDAKAVEGYAQDARSPLDHLLHVVPDSMVGALATGEILQVLLVAVLFGFALARRQAHGKQLVRFVDLLSHVLFGVVGIVVRAGPIGAFGLGSLAALGKLLACVYLTCLLFVVLVLGAILGALEAPGGTLLDRPETVAAGEEPPLGSGR